MTKAPSMGWRMVAGLALAGLTPLWAAPAAGGKPEEAKEPLSLDQDKIKKDFEGWQKEMDEFIKTVKPEGDNEQDALQQMMSVLEQSKSIKVDKDFLHAFKFLFKREFKEATPPETEAVTKLAQLLFEEAGGGDSPPGKPGDPPPPGEKKLKWHAQRQKDGSSSSSGSGSGSGSGDGPPSGSGSSPAQQMWTPGGSAEGKTTKVGGADGAEWAKLPPRLIERYAETKLEVLPSEYGWRDQVKEFYKKMTEAKKNK